MGRAPEPVPRSGAPRIFPGDAYAVILIPSIGLDMVVVQGTDYEDLKKGPGHYLDTADPWDEHRARRDRGAPHDLPAPVLQPRPGASRATRSASSRSTARYDYIVNTNFVLPEATAGEVLAQTKDPTLVLTTCNPQVLLEPAADRHRRPDARLRLNEGERYGAGGAAGPFGGPVGSRTAPAHQVGDPDRRARHHQDQHDPQPG